MAREDRAGVELSVTFVDNGVMNELNRQYRGVNAPTDVLSFNLEDDLDDQLLGEVIIAPAVALSQADEQGVSLADEIKLLLVHDILHLLGFLHDTNSEALIMERRQEELLTYFSNHRRPHEV